MPIQLDLMPLEEKVPDAPPPKTMVVRYGYLKEIGEFHSDVSQKVGCGTKLVVRTDRGTELAEMLTTTCGNGGCSKSITRDKMLEYIDLSGGRDYPFSDQGRILRIATSQDLLEQSKLDENRQKHLNLARELVQTHKLAMKIVDVEHLLGGERILFYFVSEHRIDFRSLVRDMAHSLHTRIEMRQVGARDEARITADYEKCGQHCCCKQFLKVLTPISMRSAKVQKATLDPTKISGRCGRLMCCLRYEDQTYEELRKKLPKRNSRVTTEKGDAWVIDGQILTQLVLCQFDDGTREAIPMEKITAFDRPKPLMADGRVMQTPNDRPPPSAMVPGEVPRRGPGSPGGPNAPRGQNGGPAMRRPQPGTPAPGRPGNPLAPNGPTGGDFPHDELDDLLADALEDAATPSTAARGKPPSDPATTPPPNPPGAEAAAPFVSDGPQTDPSGDPRALSPDELPPRHNPPAPNMPRDSQPPRSGPPQARPLPPRGPQQNRPPLPLQQPRGPRPPQQQQRGPGGPQQRNQPFRPPQPQNRPPQPGPAPQPPQNVQPQPPAPEAPPQASVSPPPPPGPAAPSIPESPPNP